MGWIEFDRVGDARCTGVVDEVLAASIMMHVRSEVPTVDCMRGPRCSSGRCLVYQIFCDWWSKGSFVVIEFSVEILIDICL